MRKGQTEIGLVFCCIVFLFLIIGGFTLIGFNHQEVIKCTVDSKERIISGYGENAHGKFMIYCNEEVVQNTDELFAWKFNSADLQRDMKVGNTYSIRVCGYRIPFLSMFRNIIKIERTQNDPQ